MAATTVLGWREWVALPDLGITHIKAKIDTGARTSALHTGGIERLSRAGRDWVRFRVHPVQGDTVEELSCEAPLLEQRYVKDSGGHEELRYVIETTLKIGHDQRIVEFTLTDRDTMKFRVLIGRTALRGHYLVDPSRSFLSEKVPAAGLGGKQR